MGLTSLRNISNIGQSLLNDMVNTSVIEFFDWALLGVGNFVNIVMPTSGNYGGETSKLRLVDDPRYVNGRIWEGFRSNWVWENNVAFSNQPIPITGIYVNNAFIPNNSGYYVNYPQGRIVFDTAIATTSKVQLQYSYKFINVYTSESEWFRKIQPDSFRLDNAEFAQYGSGVWSTLSEARIQLPAIIVEVVPRRSYTGLQLGGGQYVDQNVLFHIYAETTFDRNYLSDVISYQNLNKIVIIDKKKMLDSGVFPLDYRKTTISNPLTYPNIIQNYGKYMSWFTEMHPQEDDNITPGLFTAKVRATLRIECPDL